jgi:two-component system, chemotaxis family, sensor kinase CheA
MMDMRDKLLETFLAESDEILADLERTTLAMAEGADDGLLADVFRQVHTLKGNASCLSFEALTRASHALEDALSVAIRTKRGHDDQLLALLLDAVDTLSRLVRDASDGKDEPEGPAVASICRRAETWTASVALAAPTAAAAPAAATVAVAVAAADDHMATRTVRVDVDRLDHALELAGGLTVARGRLGEAMNRGDLTTAGTALEAADLLIRELERQILELRLVSLRADFERLRRVVREIGHSVGKDVRLDVRCEGVEVDMAVAEALRSPITHLLRNAIDHGIEAPSQRERAGKPRQGRIAIEAWQEGGHLVVELTDDGAGMDRERLLERAEAMCVATDELDEDEVWDLAFLPGLSTAERVGDLSGRGIGMDVVRRSIEGLRGAVRLHSVAGAGVTVTLRLPLALSIIQGLTVGVADEVFVLPLDSVIECVHLDPERAVRSARGGVLELRGDALPYLGLGSCLRGHVAGDGRAIVVVEHDGQRLGLAVDELHGEIQTVIKPIGRMFDNVRGIVGSAVLGDGRLALVVDVRGLFRYSSQEKGIAC